MTEVPEQLSFAFEPVNVLPMHFELYVVYDVRTAPKGGYNLHITKNKFDGQKGDRINIYAGHRQTLMAGGVIGKVYTSILRDIPIGDFAHWDYKPTANVALDTGYNALLKLFGESDQDEITCIIYSNNEI